MLGVCKAGWHYQFIDQGERIEIMKKQEKKGISRKDNQLHQRLKIAGELTFSNIFKCHH
jgi:hypothetical protein